MPHVPVTVLLSAEQATGRQTVLSADETFSTQQQDTAKHVGSAPFSTGSSTPKNLLQEPCRVLQALLKPFTARLTTAAHNHQVSSGHAASQGSLNRPEILQKQHEDMAGKGMMIRATVW
ncbi:hypothetical protein Anapl_09130 [Anas platyrhynchos]|uniref:Uncharacterized protein n=1 Tax=Anas platyrhynchos TaxID=8839 RepID=R0LG39_ANAPL|nr:hypothetical protein Anapl_09130 [Anas platyrhynchos]